MTNSTSQKSTEVEAEVNLARVSLDPDTIFVRELRVDIWEEIDIEKVDPEHEIEQEDVVDIKREEKYSPPEQIVLERDLQEEKYSRGEFEIAKTTLTERVLEDGKEREHKEVREKVVRRHLEEEVRFAPTYNLENAFQTKVTFKPLVLNKQTKCKVVILYSTYGITSHEEQAIRRTIWFFEARKFPLEYVDAALKDKKLQDRRAVFEKVSGLKCWWAPKFPQIFIRLEDESVVYVGDWDRVQELLDCDALNRAFVTQNNIPTFSAVFGDFIDITDVKRTTFPGDSKNNIL